MLQHMVKADPVNGVLHGMDQLLAVFERRFDDEGAGIAGFRGGGVVGACVAAFGLDVGDVAVLFFVGQFWLFLFCFVLWHWVWGWKGTGCTYGSDYFLDECGQAGIDIVGDNTN